MEWLPLKDTIERFWSEPAHQHVQSWTAHEDINAVMLATSLAPHGYLGGRERLTRSRDIHRAAQAAAAGSSVGTRDSGA